MPDGSVVDYKISSNFMLHCLVSFFNLFNPYWWFQRFFKKVGEEKEVLDDYYQ
jgi:hypothetical protein